jgi:hypothetical protein
MLTLTTWDCDTGKLLESTVNYFEKREVWSDTIEDCRRWGVDAAHERSKMYRSQGIGNASSNVDCEWLREGAPA